MPVIRPCSHCGQKNRVPAKNLADTGRCGQCKSPLPPIGEPIAVDETLFDEIVQNVPVPVLVDFCIQNFGGKVGIAGISLGGFISFAAVPVEKRLSACVPILGSPDWNHRDGRQPDAHLLELMKQAPIHVPQEFPPCALLIANAAKDILVPPQASRVFAEALVPFYAAVPERLHYLEYPESEHMMREQDWVDLWRQIIVWLLRFVT